MQYETFAPLEQLDFITHAFTLRCDEDTRSDDYERRLVESFGFSEWARAGQPHAAEVAVVVAAVPGGIPGVDSLITREPGLPLLVRCADCAAVYIVDRATPAIALIHSGKQGTRLNIVANTLSAMHRHLGTQAHDCLAFISPCIGPCHYEMDLWSGIERQLRDAGLTEIHNPRICTACRLDRYFSYRAERGKTGRMLALLALTPV